MPATSPTNIALFPAPKTPVWQLGLDEVFVYCVGRPGCGEQSAVADPETKSFVMDARGVEAAYSLLRQSAWIGLAALSLLRLPHHSVWVEYDRGRRRRGGRAGTSADGTILLHHVGRAGSRALGMPIAWDLLDVPTQSPEIDQEALLARSPVATPKLDSDWATWFSASFRPVRRDDRALTMTEYRN